MPLRLRFGIVMSALVMGVVIATSAILYFSEKRFLVSEALTQEENILSSLAQVAREGYLSQDDLMVINYTRNLPADDPRIVFAYVAGSGRIWAHSRRELTGAPAVDLPAPARGIRVLSSPVVVKNQAVAQAVAGFSEVAVEQSVEKALLKTKTRILLVCAVMVIVGILASLVLSATLTRPISRLAFAVAELGQGKLGTRIETGSTGGKELRLLAAEFNSMAKKLQELDEMKKDFVSAVTHELKSPLAAIESHLALMVYESKKPANMAQWIEDIASIRNHTARLRRFVTDLLDLAKLERGAFTLRPTATQIEPLALEIGQFMRALAQQGSVSLEVSVPGGLAPVAGDPEQIRQVMINLVSNALKFTPAGGKVVIGLEAGPSEVLCRVSDSGIGVAPEDAQRIFDKFEQVESARPSARGPKGTGLGLSICRAIVLAHGGRIWVESRSGAGSRFCFTIPYWKTSAVASGDSHENGVDG